MWSCQSTFGGGGAFVDGEWISTEDATFDATAKPTVDGSVTWASSYDIELDGDVRRLVGNGLPDHATGEFPVDPFDDAYAYDRNPNAIAAQDLDIDLPATPELADDPSCTSLGAIGVMTTGSVLFNALDARGEDAVAHEIQDDCSGHPERRGQYHYHDLSECIDDGGTGHSGLVGYALDGFGIYGSRGEDGTELRTSDLDECHGHTHEIEWDGRLVAMYHYHATAEYPYTVGCYRGTPAT